MPTTTESSAARVPHVELHTAERRHLQFVLGLMKRFSNEVGFLPRPAVEWYIESGRCLLAFENGEPAGYILGRDSLKYDRRICPITQTAVCFDAQRRHVGIALFAARSAAAQLNGRSMMQAWCAADLAANEFWHALDFVEVCRRRPNNTRGRDLVLWRKKLTAAEPAGMFAIPPIAGYRAAATSPIISAAREVTPLLFDLLPEDRPLIVPRPTLPA